MPTSLAHGVIGVAAGRATGLRYASSAWLDAAAIVAVANLPDLDLLPGLLVGDPFRFHHGFTHTLLAALLVATAAALLARRSGRRDHRGVGVLTFAVYASHLLADVLTYDRSGGLRLLRPVSDVLLRVPLPAPDIIVRYFASVDPEVSGVVSVLTSAKWLAAMGLEALLFAPLLLLSIGVRTVLARRAS